MSKYVIVEFTETVEFEAIPIRWLTERGKKAYWPDKEIPVRKAIKETWEADPEWEKCPVRLIAKTDNYEKALKKAKKAADGLVDLFTTDDENMGRRRITPSRRYMEDDEEPETASRKSKRSRSNLPRFPELSVNVPSSRRSNSVTPPAASNSVAPPAASNSVAPPAASNGVAPPAASNGVASPAAANGVAPPAASNSVASPAASNGVGPPAAANGVAPPTASNGDTPPAEANGVNLPAAANGVTPPAPANGVNPHANGHNGNPPTPTTPARPRAHTGNDAVRTPTTARTPTTNKTPSTARTPLQPGDRAMTLIRGLEEVKALAKQNNKILLKLLRRDSVETSNDVLDRFNFPLNSHEEIQDAEEALGDRHVFKAVVSRLVSLGGKGDAVRRIMAFLLTNTIAEEYNWMGRGKRAFRNLRLTKAILEAGRKHSDNDAATEDKIKNWLKYSKDRDGARKSRFQRRAALQRDLRDEPQDPRDPQDPQVPEDGLMRNHLGGTVGWNGDLRLARIAMNMPSNLHDDSESSDAE